MSKYRLGPVQALRRIQEILADKSMSRGQQTVEIAVVTHANNKTARAWTSYDKCLKGKYGFSPATVRAGLKKAIETGRLRLTGVGQNGAKQYEVVLQDVKRQETQGTTENEAPVLRKSKRGTTQNEDILTPVTNLKTKTASRKAGTNGHQRFVKWFCDEYQRQTGIKYDFQGKKDGQAVKRLVVKYSFDEMQAMTGAMFGDTWGKDNASPAILWSQRNKWRQKAAPAGNSQAAQAEKRRLAELRGIVHGD